jgi:hypothetical protein
MFLTEGTGILIAPHLQSNNMTETECCIEPLSEEFDFLRQMKGVSLSQISSIKLMNRMDTKYILPFSKLPGILKQVSGSYYIQEIDAIRVASYETIYYDFPSMQFFHAHVNGKLNRCKVRKREYTDCNLVFLEVKSKNNKGKTIKKRVKVEGNSVHFEEDAFDLVQKYANANLFLLYPILRNQFKRITLINPEMTERVTIDFYLRFMKTGAVESVMLPSLVIIEIKQEKFNDSMIRDILFRERIRKTGISKYCLGVALTEPGEKLNRMKRKLRRIQKITTYEYVA